ncbi:nuclear transport factor 2 family protein [Demequina sp. SYSU T00039]|uniref:Nuclear transport factor 2 family protein n=1 Tax=Demequina lignilytica TaxID=3051663 RepID=A0AAW7M525_9MICO|nr:MULTISPECIES: nuclear transport factor 2 family protein [unclassified Demequina]MDN4478517.1 nuclear transport factor 2 family protein [Demequina sp. SYSU T00039-1]MDN4486976.1 nuclear transport factor 2 family protein [Demequina sp. SYSU T00039]
MALTGDQTLTLHALEEAMWRAETRFDYAFMERILDPLFVEIGYSGRRWTRAETLDLDPMDIDVRLPLEDFAAVEVVPGVAQVTYRSTPDHGVRGAALRSSLWVLTDAWRIRFHQATPTPT